MEHRGERQAGRAARVLTSAGLVVALVAGAGLAGCQQAQGPALPRYHAVPPFALTDQEGRTVRGADLRGRVVVANFVYTSCTDTCPTLSSRMAALQGRLREAGLLGREVQLLSVSVDPRRDTPEVLRAYAARFGADPDAWRFLTGEEEAVRRLLVEGFKVGLAPMPAAHGGHGEVIMHSNRLVLVDREGAVRGLYDGLDVDLDGLLRDVRGLAG